MTLWLLLLVRTGYYDMNTSWYEEMNWHNDLLILSQWVVFRRLVIYVVVRL